MKRDRDEEEEEEDKSEAKGISLEPTLHEDRPSPLIGCESEEVDFNEDIILLDRDVLPTESSPSPE
jgi:hypothetical protein